MTAPRAKLLYFSAIERLCPEADVEVDMNTGKLWGSTPTVYQAYEGSMWRPSDSHQPCSLSAVLALDMTKHTAGKKSFTSNTVPLRFLPYY